jgi:hypothetical protein
MARVALTGLIFFIAGYSAGGTEFALKLNDDLGATYLGVFGIEVVPPERPRCHRLTAPFGPVWKCPAMQPESVG